MIPVDELRSALNAANVGDQALRHFLLKLISVDEAMETNGAQFGTEAQTLSTGTGALATDLVTFGGGAFSSESGRISFLNGGQVNIPDPGTYEVNYLLTYTDVAAATTFQAYLNGNSTGTRKSVV